MCNVYKATYIVLNETCTLKHSKVTFRFLILRKFKTYSISNWALFFQLGYSDKPYDLGTRRQLCT